MSEDKVAGTPAARTRRALHIFADPQRPQTLLTMGWNEASGHAWEKQPYFLKRRSHMASVSFAGHRMGWFLFKRKINLAYLRPAHESYYRVICKEAR